VCTDSCLSRSEGKALEAQREKLLEELRDTRASMISELEHELEHELEGALSLEKAHELVGRVDRRLSMQYSVPDPHIRLTPTHGTSKHPIHVVDLTACCCAFDDASSGR
jgi:hypothetical protein